MVRIFGKDAAATCERRDYVERQTEAGAGVDLTKTVRILNPLNGCALRGVIGNDVVRPAARF